jgi:hypothetical protein
MSMVTVMAMAMTTTTMIDCCLCYDSNGTIAAMGSTKCTLFGIVLFELNIFSCIPQVPSIDSTCSLRMWGS